MISQSDIDYFRKVGIWYTGIPALSPASHIAAFSDFLSKEQHYKEQFLQTHFDKLFDGYSYLGQGDSKNQYEKDRLYTYVLSDFFDSNMHPVEMNPILWEQNILLQKIANLEVSLLQYLDSGLNSDYSSKIGHSLSANYYPSGKEEKVRLTEHTDGSLFTVFPFGMDEEFQYLTANGSWQRIKRTNEIICFSGYFLEKMTGIPALPHKVEKVGLQKERFSFAYFSVPKPGEVFEKENETLHTDQFFKQYLALFE